MSNPYEAPDLGWQMAAAEIKMTLVDGERRIALIVAGSIVALLDPAKVAAVLRFYGS